MAPPADDDPAGLVLDESEEVQSSWQTTMADMSMLLLCFFIFLFSLATLKPESVEETLESVRQRLKTDVPQVKGKPDTEIKAKEKILEQVSLRERLLARERQVYDDVNAYFRSRGDTSMRTTLNGARMIISVPTDGMFVNGDYSQLTDAGRQRLKAIADVLARHPDQRVNIKGFTDDVPPPPGSRFKNNWEVSSLMAVAALRQLMALGVPSNRLTSTGLADLEPLLPNTTDENRARNRRLDFVMEVQVEG